MNLTVRPLTPDLWPQLEELFGRVGACNGCWCMYWRIGGAYSQRPRAGFKTVATPAAHRPLMRLDLARKKKAA
jgi:hypothetical protein